MCDMPRPTVHLIPILYIIIWPVWIGKGYHQQPLDAVRWFQTHVPQNGLLNLTKSYQYVSSKFWSAQSLLNLHALVRSFRYEASRLIDEASVVFNCLTDS